MRVCGGVLGGALVVGAAAVIATACTHDDSTIFVHGVLAQQLVAPGQTCLYTSDPTQATIVSGLLDMGIVNNGQGGAGYVAEFLVGNQLVPQGNPSAPATETSYAEIQGAVVRITDIAGNPVRSYTQLLGATIPPSVGTTPGYAPIPVTVVDAVATSMYLASVATGNGVRLISYTRFFGKTLGGQSVESNEFEFPVDLCFGCLVSFPTGVTSESFTPTPNCVNIGAALTTTASLPCTLGQDDSVPCTACLGAPVCRATGLTSVFDAGMGGSPTD